MYYFFFSAHLNLAWPIWLNLKSFLLSSSRSLYNICHSEMQFICPFVSLWVQIILLFPTFTCVGICLHFPDLFFFYGCYNICRPRLHTHTQNLAFSYCYKAQWGNESIKIWRQSRGYLVSVSLGRLEGRIIWKSLYLEVTNIIFILIPGPSFSW